MNLPTKKRYRQKLDVLTNEEDEQEDDYRQARRVKRRIIPEVEAELAQLMNKLSVSPCRKYPTKRKYTNSEQDEEEQNTRIKQQKTSTQEHGRDYDMDALTDWTSLPTDIVFLILDKLLERIDNARFGVVCKDWRSVSEQYNRATKPHLKVFPPMLLWMPPAQSDGSNDPTTMLYSLTERKFYSNIKLPVPGDHRMIYCGHGWMAQLDSEVLDYYSLGITLINHFGNTKDIIRLPPIEVKFPYNKVRKITLSDDPTLDRNNYVVLAIWGTKLYIKRGQQPWTWIDYDGNEGCSAATFYRGQVFSVVSFGRFQKVVSYRDNSSIISCHMLQGRRTSLTERTYFVKSSKGDLLIVERLLQLGSNTPSTLSFKVSKMVFNEDGSIAAGLDEVNNIDDETLFVGDNLSVSVVASNFPGCRPNSIYYTNDVYGTQTLNGERLEDIRIFNLEDGSHETITPHFPHEFDKGHGVWVTLPYFPVC